MFAASKSGRAVAAANTDPYFPNVTLLLEPTSTNGQQNNTFLDSSTNNFTLTRSGTPTQGSVTPYWPNGYWGNYFNGSTSDYLSTPNSANLVLGSSNYTIECWVFPTVSASSLAMISKGNTSSLGTEFWTLEFSNTTGGFSFYVGAYSSGSPLLTGTATLNAWNHIAVVRNGLVHNLYVNGTSVSNITIGSSYTVASGGNLYLATGWYTPASRAITGYISNARLVIGTAVYTSNFTPSTTPLTAITNTQLLTCQSNRFVDNSTNNFAITATGTPKVQAFQPFSPTASYTTALYGGSGYFNGSTDYLSNASSSAFTFGTADFTVEYWVYCPSLPGPFTILCGGNASSATDIGFGFNPSSPYCTHNANWPVYTTTAMPTNAWTHLAFTRTSGTWKLYMNGVDVTTGSQSNPNVTTATLGIGATSGGTSKFIGYICNLRVVKGVAVYTGAFTPPTLAPLTTAGSTSAASYSSTTNVNTSFASSATSLLTNFTNAGIYDAAVQNNEVTVGSAQASTTVAKWSPTSMKFNGTTDYLTSVRGDGYNLGTVYTVEAWVYPSSVSGNQGIINLSTGATVNAGFNFYLVGSTVTVNNGSIGGTGPSGGTLTTGQWYYIAIVCNGTNTVLYINGTLTNTYVGVTGFTGTWTNATIGNIADKTMYFNGYIQDLRLTKGIARTITTPTAAFPTR